MVEGKFMSGGDVDPRVSEFFKAVPTLEKKNLRVMDVEPKYFKSKKIKEVVLEFYEFKGETCVDINIYNNDHPDTPVKSSSFNLEGFDTFVEFLTYNALTNVLFEGADSYAERKFLAKQLEGYVLEKSGLEKK
jgi:hypothetical protein